MINDLLLFSGNDIPYYSAQVTVHQPTINEIAFLGEQNFYNGCELLTFSKDAMLEEDKNKLKDVADFDIMMTMINNQVKGAAINSLNALMVLSLVFPKYKVSFSQDEIILTEIKDENTDSEEIHIINRNNYNEFKDIFIHMFCLDEIKKENGEDYNPVGDRARALMEKFKARHKKLAEMKEKSGDKTRFSILERYSSILAVGLQKDINLYMNYTVYQLFDEFKRFQLKQSYDVYLQAKLAGAKDLDEVEHWMKDLH